MPLLDLSNADVTGFDPIPGGVYFAEIQEAEWKETKGGENAKMPKGTPMLNVQFRIVGKPGETDGEDSKFEFFNRRVFRSYLIPPAKGYDKEKGAKMKGMFVRFLADVGYSQETITKPDFDLDVNELKEKKLRVSVSRREATVDEAGVEVYAASNDVKGTKPWEGATASAGSLLT